MPAKVAEQKRTAAAVKKALADKKAADEKADDKADDRVYAAPRSNVVTLSSLGAKPCTELANRGVDWT